MTRGGGTGFAGGAVPQGGIVLGLERMARVRAFDPLLWRIHVEAGVRDRRAAPDRARERPLLPARPGCGRAVADRRQRGHERRRAARLQVRVTGAWVTGVEAVLPPGEIVDGRRPGPQGRRRLRPDGPPDRLRGHARDRDGRLAAADPGRRGRRSRSPPSTPTPMPAARRSRRVIGSGIVPAALEYLDERPVAIAGHDLPGGAPAGASWSSPRPTAPRPRRPRGREELREALAGDGATVGSRRRTATTRGALALAGRRLARASPAGPRRQARRGHRRPASTGWPRRSAAAVEDRRAARPRGDAAGATPATATCTRASWSSPATRRPRPRRGGGRRAVRSRRSRSAARSPASTASGCSSGRTWRTSSARPARRLNAEIKRAFDPKGLLNPGKG